MPDRVIADFHGSFAGSELSTEDPQTGRILMNRRQLVLAASEGEHVTISLDQVFDVAVGQAPRDVSEFFGDTVTVAYGESGPEQMAIVEGDPEDIGRFKSVLFKALLSGQEVAVKHPARVGGRVVDSPVERARVKVDSGVLTFERESSTFAVDVSDVVSVERTERDLTQRAANSTIEVKHYDHNQDRGRMQTTMVSLPSRRLLNVLGRFIRLEYNSLRGELADVDLTENEMEALAGVYMGGSAVDIATVIDADASVAGMIYDGLIEKGLLEEAEDGVRLTTRGKIIVNERIESVNA